MRASTSVISALGHRRCHLAVAFTYRVHELDLRNIEIQTRSFKIYGIWPQASKQASKPTYTRMCAMQSR